MRALALPFLFPGTISGLSLHNAQILARIVGEAWEHCVEVAVAEVLGDDFAEHAAVIGGDGKVAALIELAVAQAPASACRPSRL